MAGPKKPAIFVMSILTRLRNKYRSKSNDKGIIEHTAEYFEMEYLKFGKKLRVCFMAPNLTKARIKAEFILPTINGEKVLHITKLDSKRLGQSLTWNRDGSDYSQYQRKSENIKVYRKIEKDRT